VNLLDATAAKPKNFEQAVNGPEKVEWMDNFSTTKNKKSL